MKKLLILFFLFAFQQFNFANDSIPGKKIVFITKITTADGKIIPGYLANINDTAVSFTKEPFPLGTLHENQSISYLDISSLNVHRKGYGGKCAGFGALIGFSMGVLAGVSSGSGGHGGYAVDPGPLGYGLLFGLAGTVTGAIIGALTKKTFTINKNKENFQKMKKAILDEAYGTRRSR